MTREDYTKQKQEDFLKMFDSKQRSFEMYTPAGDKRCQALTRACINKVFGKKRLTERELEEFIDAKMSAMAKGKHKEVYDTEPRYDIKRWVRMACDVVGYNFNI